jgi:hypothetical protein
MIRGSEKYKARNGVRSMWKGYSNCRLLKSVFILTMLEVQESSRKLSEGRLFQTKGTNAKTKDRRWFKHKNSMK